MSASAERGTRAVSSVTSASIISAPLRPREGGAVVTVDHEVSLAELDGDDRRERAVGERALERAQPVAAEGVERAEVAGERGGAAVRADERVERDRTDAEVPAPERLQSPLDLVELEQALVATGSRSLHLEVKSTSVRPDHG